VSRTQRLFFLGLAAVIAVGAVILLAGGGDDEQSANTSAEATPTATATATATDDAEAEEASATPEPTPRPRPQPPLIEPGKVTNLRFEQGERVRFRARSDQPDEIHVHVYDITRDTGPDPVLVSFPATVTGIFEIELHGTGEQIAQLRVDP
jgi:pyruvate/2-oxoglutarate dehydrogenase complex dihydrolipoamide acyltransferase (E2) component